MRIIDLVGQRFERVLVVSRAANLSTKDTNARWNCICDCGKEFISYGQDMRRGKTKSCGCLTRSKIGALGSLRKTHGMSKTAIYRRWRNMHDRCGERGKQGYFDVSVCERWNSFENFIADMGMPPNGFTLDRKDPFGDYSPENCRWANSKTQANNRRRKTITLKHNGKELTIEEWAKELGITTTGMYSRIWKKSPPEIMFAPRIRSKPSS